MQTSRDSSGLKPAQCAEAGPLKPWVGAGPDLQQRLLQRWSATEGVAAEEDALSTAVVPMTADVARTEAAQTAVAVARASGTSRGQEQLLPSKGQVADGKAGGYGH